MKSEFVGRTCRCAIDLTCNIICDNITITFIPNISAVGTAVD